MRQVGTEEKAALLLTSADDDDHVTRAPDNVPVVVKRRRTYHERRPASDSQSVIVFLLILGAFVVGCVSGVVIMLYRMSQDGGHSPLLTAQLTRVDPTVRAKLFQSITKNNFVNLTRAVESEIDAANRLEQAWQSLAPKVLTRVNKLAFDLTLSTYAPAAQWSGIRVLDAKTEREMKKYDLSATNEYLTLSSLVKSGQVQANFIYYVNYGRPEDFAYLIKKNLIQPDNNDKTIVFMRRKATVISQTAQIRQASRYGFAGLVLFDDVEPHPVMNVTNDRQSFADEWKALSSSRQRQQFLDGALGQDDPQIVVLILSYPNVQSLFTAEPNDWFPCPSEWKDASTTLRVGGPLLKTKFHLTASMQDAPAHLPAVLGYLRGTTDADRFVMIGYQLGRKQQEKVLNEIISAFEQQKKQGWEPRRSIVFCAWSGLSYDRHTIQQWISNNYRLLDQNLVAYIDLGNGIVGNSTLNLHGSPLLQQVAQRAADAVVSPLVHDHACHHRQPQAPMPQEHVHGRRRRHGDDHGSTMPMTHGDHETQCEPHKLLDEWLRASKNRIDGNRTTNIVQMIDVNSGAALFQLQHGIPSLLIEMTDEPAVTRDTFYARNWPAVFNDGIQPEIAVAYTQFVLEVLRQLADEPLIPFNVTDYAVVIEKQAAGHLALYQNAYSRLDESGVLKQLVEALAKAMRALQSRIDQTAKNNFMDLQLLNEKLIELERLFIFADTTSLPSRHLLFGSAFGQTNTAVPFPLLSNLLVGLEKDSPTELHDASKAYWLKVKQQLQLTTRTLQGLDGLLGKA